MQSANSSSSGSRKIEAFSFLLSYNIGMLLQATKEVMARIPDFRASSTSAFFRANP